MDSRERINVRDQGAAGDGQQRDTEVLQSALDEAAENGGTVRLPPGEYLSAPLVVGDDTTLRVDAGATLRFVRDYQAFPDAKSRWEGWDQVGFHPCLRLYEAENVEITGAGTIDGQGDYWWQFCDGADSEMPAGLRERLAEFSVINEQEDDVSSFTLRPPLLQVYDSENVAVSGVTLKRSPFWNTHVVYSDNVTLHDLTVSNPADAPNGDGIDIDSSQHVRISDTYINAGDDAICLKSGKNEAGRAVGVPAAQIAVTNCTVEAGHGGVVIGSEMSGDVRDVVVSNCTFTNTDRGIRIKTQRDRGGVVEDLRFDTIVMRHVACPFVINGYYFMDIDSDEIPVDEGTPMVRNVNFHDITARDVESAAFLAGLPEQRFRGISFENVDIDATRDLDATDLSPAMASNYEQRHGLFCKSIEDVSFDNVAIRTPEGPAMTFEETGSVTIDGLDVSGVSSPAIVVNDVERTAISGCDGATAPETFLEASGDGVVSLAGNHGSLGSAINATDEVIVQRE